MLKKTGGGNMGLATGRVWTQKGHDERRKRVLSTPLP